MPDRVVTMTEIDRLRVRANAALNNLRALVHAGRFIVLSNEDFLRNYEATNEA